MLLFPLSRTDNMCNNLCNRHLAYCKQNMFLWVRSGTGIDEVAQLTIHNIVAASTIIVTIQLAFLGWVRRFKAQGSERQEFSHRFYDHCGHHLLCTTVCIAGWGVLHPLLLTKNLSTLYTQAFLYSIGGLLVARQRFLAWRPLSGPREPRFYWSFAPGSAFPTWCPCWSWQLSRKRCDLLTKRPVGDKSVLVPFVHIP